MQSIKLLFKWCAMLEIPGGLLDLQGFQNMCDPNSHPDINGCICNDGFDTNQDLAQRVSDFMSCKIFNQQSTCDSNFTN